MKNILPAIIGSLLTLIVGLLLFTKGYISHIKVTELGIVEIKWDEIKDITFEKVSLELKNNGVNKNIKALTN
ncbi:hypothetical protein [Flavobacterium sp. U410]